jgi:hypothetical protein
LKIDNKQLIAEVQDIKKESELAIAHLKESSSKQSKEMKSEHQQYIIDLEVKVKLEED